MLINYKQTINTWRMHVKVIVLCGGKSRRMGEDKARLQLNNRTFLQMSVEKFQSEFDVCVASGVRDYSDIVTVPQIRDIYEEAGPLAGLHAIMSTYSDELFFVMPVDCPNVDSNLIHTLHEKMLSNPDCDVVVPIDATGKKQVLIALYRRTTLPLIEKALKQGNNRVMSVLNQCNIEYVELGDIELLNVNTPEEYQRAMTL